MNMSDMGSGSGFGVGPVGRKPSQVYNYMTDNKCNYCGHRLAKNTSVMKKHFFRCNSTPKAVKSLLKSETIKYNKEFSLKSESDNEQWSQPAIDYQSIDSSEVNTSEQVMSIEANTSQNSRGRKPSEVSKFTEDYKCIYCGKYLSKNTSYMKRHFNSCKECPNWVRIKLNEETVHYKSQSTHSSEQFDDQFHDNDMASPARSLSNESIQSSDSSDIIIKRPKVDIKSTHLKIKDQIDDNVRILENFGDSIHKIQKEVNGIAVKLPFNCRHFALQLHQSGLNLSDTIAELNNSYKNLHHIKTEVQQIIDQINEKSA